MRMCRTRGIARENQDSLRGVMKAEVLRIARNYGLDPKGEEDGESRRDRRKERGKERHQARNAERGRGGRGDGGGRGRGTSDDRTYKWPVYCWETDKAKPRVFFEGDGYKIPGKPLDSSIKRRICQYEWWHKPCPKGDKCGYTHGYSFDDPDPIKLMTRDKYTVKTAHGHVKARGAGGSSSDDDSSGSERRSTRHSRGKGSSKAAVVDCDTASVRSQRSDISAITEQTSKMEALMVSNNQLLSRMSSRMDAHEEEMKELRSCRGKRRDILSEDEDSD